MDQHKYKVEIYVTHYEWVYAENEEEAKEKAQLNVFERAVDHKNGEHITAYKVIPLRSDADMQ